ncbi:MAG: PilZ domain-containing protein [Acidothermus sp.]|nr:PilZ domain-containing protein [Acidothermus sp.]MCL6537387.1 PilZ domain-containing protein [Acidothermus sp.]
MLVPQIAPNAVVAVRLVHRDGREFTTRVESVTPQAVVVAAPPGANAALIASGSREIDLSWLSPRGRYEQRCELQHSAGTARQWRLRPLRPAVLVQRRRHIRVRAAVPVVLHVAGEALPGSTVDVSEGGFRVRIPPRDLPELEPATVHVTIGGRPLELRGYLLRGTFRGPQDAEAVVAFEDLGSQGETLRHWILQLQLRSRAAHLTSRG